MYIVQFGNLDEAETNGGGCSGGEFRAGETVKHIGEYEMHQSSKAFFEKDSFLMWSTVCAVVLWIINGAFNLAAGSYTSFFINLFYVICLLALSAVTKERC